MNKRTTIRSAAALCALVLGVWLAVSWWNHSRPGSDRLILLVPDGASFSDPRVTVWLDAGSEEGLHVVPMHDSGFLSPFFGKPHCAGVILPDSIHQRASDLFVGELRRYIAAGGHLMLVYDAGTKSMQGFYAGGESRLSDLAGAGYALYKDLGGAMIQSSEVSGATSMMDDLGVPPGKYFPFSKSAVSNAGEAQAQLRRYQYGSLEYPSFVTPGKYSGQVLLRSRAGVAAGVHPYGRGAVLFVNLPLASLAQNTDGLPLHAFLKYFAERVLSLPYLLPVPDGVGGIVLNWHIDSNAAIKSLQEVMTWSIIQQGPYSIDITAGPDAHEIGDGRGFDVLHNPVSQDLVHRVVQLGEEVGSHGGWVHDYFATHVDTDPPEQMAKFLELNKDALEQVAGKPVVEYSAPAGNQPEWVTHWLEAHGFVAYYFTGDTGLGPTQVYRDGHRTGQDIWAFPIVHLDRAASFEEMAKESLPLPDVEQWLDSLTDFVVSHRQVRLVYFHPPGILPYRQIVDDWLEKTAQLRQAGRFRWYTMTQIANFLNSRKKLTWKLTERNGLASLDADAPATLAHEAWRFPAKKYGKPVVIRGSATITQDGDGWIVVAEEGKQLEVEARVSAQ